MTVNHGTVWGCWLESIPIVQKCYLADNEFIGSFVKDKFDGVGTYSHRVCGLDPMYKCKAGTHAIFTANSHTCMPHI